MGKKQGKDMVKCNFFVNGFMNISMERSEILFHFCKNITLKCHHLHHFPLLSTSLSPNSSTKDSRIKKFYATEYTGYSEYIYACVFIHTLNISDHLWSFLIIPRFLGMNFPFLLLSWWISFTSRMSWPWGKSGRQQVPQFFEESVLRGIARKHGLNQCFLNHTRELIQIKTNPSKNLSKAFLYRKRSDLIWFVVRPHQQLLCTVSLRLRHDIQLTLTNQSLSHKLFHERHGQGSLFQVSTILMFNYLHFQETLFFFLFCPGVTSNHSLLPSKGLKCPMWHFFHV